MRDAERFADPAGVIDILPCTAGTGAVHGCTVVVELKRDAEDVIALLLEDSRHHGGVHAAGHGDDNPGVFRPLIKVERVQSFSNRQSYRGSRPRRLSYFRSVHIERNALTRKTGRQGHPVLRHMQVV